MLNDNLSQSARELLCENDRGGYTVPSDGLYPYQWNWDSAFVSRGLATFHPARAWREIDMLMAAQWPCGMVPHIVFRADEPSYFPGPDFWQAGCGPLPASGITQPPVVASAVRAISAADPDTARVRKNLAALVPQLDAWHGWFLESRHPRGDGVICVVHPWESGRDNLPDWDQPAAGIDVSRVGSYTRRDLQFVAEDMRPGKSDYDRYLALILLGRDVGWNQTLLARHSPFLVADVCMGAVLVRAERDLLALAREYGFDERAIAARLELLENGLRQLWNARIGAYCSYDMRGDCFIDTVTSANFLLPYAGIFDHMAELVASLAAMARHVRFLVPSFDPGHGDFDPVRYWRGPVWPMMNFMIALGLQEAGEKQWAQRLRSDTRMLIEQSGFSEYFSPLDGAGCGGGSFSWAAAVWLFWSLGEFASTDFARESQL